MDARKNRTADMSLYQPESGDNQDQSQEDRLVKDARTNEILAMLRTDRSRAHSKRRWVQR